MPEKLLSTLDPLLVCHTATPSPTSVQKDENLSKPEERGRAGVSRFKFWSSTMKGISFYFIITSLFCILFLFVSLDQFMFYFFLLPKGKKSLVPCPNNFVSAQTFY